MAKITRVWAREILDSRGIPTLEAACQLDSGHITLASVPSGTSTGTYEALELRDKDSARYQGQGVLKAVSNVNQILNQAVIGLDPTNQQEIDKRLIAMDGTENKSKLGANSILAVSIAAVKAGSLAANTNLYNWIANLIKNKGAVAKANKVPTPIFNMINGGLHGAGNLDFQEFWVIPASSRTYSEGLQIGVEIYHLLGESLAQSGAIHSIGDEGGYAPNLFTNADALQIIVETIKRSPYNLGRDLFLGLDVAANSFFEAGNYSIKDKSAPLDENTLIEYYKELNNLYHLGLLEDPLAEDSWDGWKKLLGSLSNNSILVGDDLLVTNPKRVQKAIEMGSCNAILVKPNQIGTVSETLDVINLCRSANWKIIVSHRSGETNDSFIADFSVGVAADYVKFGAPARGERVAKYNRLSAIETELSYVPQ